MWVLPSKQELLVYGSQLWLHIRITWNSLKNTHAQVPSSQGCQIKCRTQLNLNVRKTTTNFLVKVCPTYCKTAPETIWFFVSSQQTGRGMHPGESSELRATDTSQPEFSHYYFMCSFHAGQFISCRVVAEPTVCGPTVCHMDSNSTSYLLTLGLCCSLCLKFSPPGAYLVNECLHIKEDVSPDLPVEVTSCYYAQTHQVCENYPGGRKGHGIFVSVSWHFARWLSHSKSGHQKLTE